MHISKNNIEHKICESLGFKYGKLTNSGSEAIKYCLVNAKIKKNTFVIVPVTICKSVVDAILKYGCFPLFVDVDQDFCINIKDINKKYTEEITAIIYVHAYGILKDIRELVAHCKKHSICLIEDSAQYICSHNRYLDCPQGDFIIYSFGRGKPVDIGGLGFIGSNKIDVMNSPLIENINLYKKLNENFSNLNNIIQEKINKVNEYKKYFTQLKILDSEKFLDNLYHRLLVYYPKKYNRLSKQMYFYMNSENIDNYQSTIKIESFREKTIKKQLKKQHQSLTLKDFPTYKKLKKSIHYFRTCEWINNANIELICNRFKECINDEI